MRKYNITAFVHIGEIVRYLTLQPPTPRDREHSVRLIIGNGLRGDVWKKFMDRFGVPDVREGYASTEGNVGMMNINPAKAGACGLIPVITKRLFPVQFVQYEPASDTHPRTAAGHCVRCRDGEVGEGICLIGPDTPFTGYTNQQATDKKILKDPFGDGNNYFRTVEGEYVYFVDRIGDTYRWKGENISTQEVAEIIGCHQDVENSTVYGVQVPNNEGRAGMAAVVFTGSNVNESLYGFCEANLTKQQNPLFLRLLTELATTATHKISKVELQREVSTNSRQGFDPRHVSDPLYFRDAARKEYVKLTPPLYDKIVSGAIVL